MTKLVPPLLPAGVLAASEQPVLRAVAGVVLRPWRQDDIGAIVDGFGDPETQRWQLSRYDEAEARDWVAAWEPRWRSETDAGWAVCAEEGGEALGGISIREMSLAYGWGSLSYWTRAAYRGRGLATAAARVIGQWAIGDVGLHRVEVRHSIGNPPSCSVAESAGFPYEATLRSVLMHTDGFHDEHVHARIGT
jgi:[ribosomal protein S5]-alanine N-acetyltransferase